MQARYWIAGTAVAAAGTFWILRKSAPAHPRTHLLDLEPEPHPPEAENGTVQFIGTATTLIRYQGLTILTDPNFVRRGEQIHVGYGLHATRLTDPALGFDDLPPFDFVLLSHLHQDHFDTLVQRRLPPNTPILTTASAARTLARRGFTNLYPLRTWDCVKVRKGSLSLRITALPALHARMPAAAALPDVMGSMLDFRNERDGRRYRLYITGDTLVFRGLREIARRCRGVDLMLMHLGGARVLGTLLSMNAAQGIEAMRLLQPQLAIPVHYNDYDLFREPLDAFVRAVERAGLQNRVRYLHHGETCSFVPTAAYAEARPLV